MWELPKIRSQTEVTLQQTLNAWSQDDGMCRALLQAPNLLFCQFERLSNAEGLRRRSCKLIIDNVCEVPVFSGPSLHTDKVPYIPVCLVRHIGGTDRGHCDAALKLGAGRSLDSFVWALMEKTTPCRKSLMLCLRSLMDSAPTMGRGSLRSGFAEWMTLNCGALCDANLPDTLHVIALKPGKKRANSQVRQRWTTFCRSSKTQTMGCQRVPRQKPNERLRILEPRLHSASKALSCRGQSQDCWTCADLEKGAVTFACRRVNGRQAWGHPG